jgi:hypothetical protein
MFEAMVMICASTITLDVDFDKCAYIKDNWGPYKTEYNCNIRSEQMEKEIIEGVIGKYFAVQLGYPEMLYSQGNCSEVKDDTI